jgi:CopA family copper-resistance protein
MPPKASAADHRFLAISRRRFVQGTAGGAVLAGLGSSAWPLFGQALNQAPPELSGNHFDLTLGYLPVNFTGKPSIATVVNGSAPGPTLRWREGDSITIAVTNHLKTMSAIHWHGIRLPSQMDGVPGLSFHGIQPGETFHYKFPVVQSGTYWYHSHGHFQEQTGLVGALIIERRQSEPIEFDREFVVLLTDWSDTKPDTVFSNLKQDSEYYNYHQRTARTFFSDAASNGLATTLKNRWMWGRMNMTPTDMADVTGATYTYLLNGNSPVSNWTGIFQPGERVRLRFINASAMTFFDVQIPGLPMSVVQSDGNDVEPVTVDEFRIGVAETYDVIVRPLDSAYTIFAQSQDRSGFARGTLAPRAGMSAEVPPLDPPPLRTMMDMGMKMPGSKGMAGMSDQEMSAMHSDGTPSTTAEHHAASGIQMMHDAPVGSAETAMSAAGMSTSISDQHGTIPFPQPGPNSMPLPMAEPGKSKPEPANQLPLHLGPQVDQISMNAIDRLHDPGDGLANNGRRVLTYADLRARYRGVDAREPSREIELHLTGNMQRYIWGFDGKKFSAAKPIELKLGERVRFILVNDTMMDHPIHLHGLWGELENGHGEFNPYKHTIIVKPSERLSYLVSADTPGSWAYHCHLMYHMEAGMFRTVAVA